MFGLFGKEPVKSVNVNDLDKLIGKIELLDIRERYEFVEGSIKTARNIPMGDLLTSPEKYLTKDETYYMLCLSGARSSRTAASLAKQGYKVINVSGGMSSYAGTKRT